MASCTIARWLKEILRLAGIDVFIFSGHSVRGASTSAAAGAGITMTSCRQRTGVLSRYSEGSITDPLMILPIAGQCCLQPLVRPEQYCFFCNLVMGYM